MNRQALAIAKKVAAEGDALLAGNICNTNVFKPGDATAAREVLSWPWIRAARPKNCGIRQNDFRGRYVSRTR